MEYTLSVTFVMQMAATETVEAGHQEIEPEYLLLALLQYVELDLRPLFQMVHDGNLRNEIDSERTRMQQLLAKRRINPSELRKRVRNKVCAGGFVSSGGPLHRSAATKLLFTRAEERAKRESIPVGALELLEELLERPTEIVQAILPLVESEPARPMQSGSAGDAGVPPPHFALPELAQTSNDLRRILRTRVFGQEHAIEDFIEGLFAAELARDEGRNRPAGVFVFAGPPDPATL